LRLWLVQLCVNMACRLCLALPCANPPDLAAGIDGAIYSGLDYSFEVDCPDKCYCPPGLFPQTISILANTIPPVIPPINQPGDQIILQLQGCTSLITRTLDAGATQAQILAAAQAMQAEWAGQQALCNALLVPGVNCNTGSGSISVCNDAQTFFCEVLGFNVTVAAGLFCQDLNITGLNQGQIDAATAVLKANLNELASASICPAFRVVCGVTYTPIVFGGFTCSNVIIHNLSAVTKDLSNFQLCVFGGVPSPFCEPPGGPPPATSIAPMTTLAWAGSCSPLPTSFTVFYAGQAIAQKGVSFAPNGWQVDIFLCA
jgi:hypothetical protein